MIGRLFRRVVASGGVALTILAGVDVGAGQVALSEPAAPRISAANAPPRFTGRWDYNDHESINAGTGRREQVPQSATAPSTGAAAAAAARGAAGSGGGPSGLEGRTGGSRAQSTVIGNLIQNAQNFVRDLLEVPEALTIRVSADAVTFTDDLSRERVFPTDGKGREYRLSASRFDAKTVWDGRQLRREIAGGGGFKIFETYFLSDDGQRLFVIIRVKAPQRPGFIAGFNRVYDRIGPPAEPAGR